MADFILNGTRIGDEQPCYVIAELGHNHGGSVLTACEMVKAAAASGARAVKLQKRHNRTLYSPALLNKPYENENSYGKTYGAHREALEFSRPEFRDVQRVADAQNVTCFATAFDEPSADFLAEIGVPAFKIASGGLTDRHLLSYVAQFGKPIILSTGGGTWREVDEAVAVLIGTGAPFALLHCTAAYPCEFSELNLRVIPAMKDRYPGIVIGWSGHDNGIAMSVAAYAMGARIIEKHFTLNRASKGTDHAFSLEPAGLKKLCRDLSRAHVAMGDGVKRWYESEKAPISKMRRVWTINGPQVTGTLSTCSTWTEPCATPTAGIIPGPSLTTTASPSSIASTRSAPSFSSTQPEAAAPATTGNGSPNSNCASGV